jgi:hypothetical protein
VTVVHEFAHHVGIDDERLHELAGTERHGTTQRSGYSSVIDSPPLSYRNSGRERIVANFEGA